MTTPAYTGTGTQPLIPTNLTLTNYQGNSTECVLLVNEPSGACTILTFSPGEVVYRSGLRFSLQAKKHVLTEWAPIAPLGFSTSVTHQLQAVHYEANTSYDFRVVAYDDRDGKSTASSVVTHIPNP